MFSKNPAFLGQIPISGAHTFLGQRRTGSDTDCNKLKREMDEWSEAMKISAATISTRNQSVQQNLNRGETQMAEFRAEEAARESKNWEKYRKKYLDAKAAYEECLRNLYQGIESSPFAQIPGDLSQQSYQSYANVRMTPTSPGQTPVGPQIQPQIEYPTSMIEDIGPEIAPPVETGQTSSLPGAEAAQGLPCPPGQYRPPGAGWCVPKPVPTGYGGGGFGGFGGYGGIINMGPSGGVPFTMGRAMLGQVKLVRRPY